MEIPKFNMIAGSDIVIDGVCVLKQPVLNTIRAIGLDEYHNKIAWLSLDRAAFLKSFHFEEDQFPPEMNVFDILTLTPELAQVSVKSLEFFVRGQVQYSEKHKSILYVDGDKLWQITRDNYDEVCSTILRMCGIEPVAQEKEKPKNDIAAKIAAKLAKGKAKLEEAKRRQNPEQTERNSLWNIIGSVAAYSHNYNLENIWNLTVLQLYDQFARINENYYIDIGKRRWCTWGEGDYTLDPWFVVPKS